MQQSLVEAFFSSRDALIDQLEAGTIDKISFFEDSLAFFNERHFKPKGTDKLTLEESVIHYQYYNLMAKLHLMKAADAGQIGDRNESRYKDQALDYYGKKDLVSMHLVALVEYKGVSAYYIELQSKRMEGDLYEVIFTEIPRLVLHSKDKRLQNRLKQAGVFDEAIRPSIIDTYVNTRYK